MEYNIVVLNIFNITIFFAVYDIIKIVPVFIVFINFLYNRYFFFNRSLNYKYVPTIQHSHKLFIIVLLTHENLY